MTLVLLYARVVYQADVVVDVEVEQRPRLPPRLGDYQVVEREVLGKKKGGIIAEPCSGNGTRVQQIRMSP